ncbi:MULTISPECIES: DUF4231 domain-containing protein [Nitrosomonas]|uniref:Uncharacterized protein DUF4231 n=3 Tax=Nitrosomonas communis TaxID=44574 RepID=A0A5D3Y674_9PROT|nr:MULTISPECIES: DUF4231 domain-containing protein [Nitrosomonas]TYP69462.1 uncharacterized protein DUF4231 [Nitrosomonas communis]UVS60053.1 DUF4231 domain-containing protein [Nitrosomonas sp. PLL12]
MPVEPANSTVKPEWMTLIESRKQRADYFFQTVLENQREWYSKKAGIHKKRHLFFAMSVIVMGALISFLQVMDTEIWIRYLTAALGAVVSVLRATDMLLRPGETWQGYRKASENMKRECRLYLNNADVYADAGNEDAAYHLLVERVEVIIAEEQQLYWQFHAKSTVPTQESKSKNEGAK